MKDTDKLHRNVTKGVQARQELDEYKGKFADLQKIYLTELLMMARSGEPTERVACKLLALDDIVNSLAGDIQTGVRDQRKLDQIALQRAQKVESEQAS